MSIPTAPNEVARILGCATCKYALVEDLDRKERWCNLPALRYYNSQGLVVMSIHSFLDAGEQCPYHEEG